MRDRERMAIARSGRAKAADADERLALRAGLGHPPTARHAPAWALLERGPHVRPAPRGPSWRTLAAVAALLGLSAGLARAQPGASSTDEAKQARVTRIDTPPVIDGRLDDAVWAEADVIDDFHQIRPGNGTLPSERTEIRMLLDEDFLYIGAKLYETDPETITANIMRHGSNLGQDDRLSVILDPFGTGRSGYRFETNLNAVRHDMLYMNTTRVLSDWSTIWDVQAARVEDGWTFEMAIPFKSLPFDPTLDTWGVNFARAIRRIGEEDVWVSRNRSYNSSIVGQVSGFSGMSQGVGLDVVPSLILGRRTEYDPAEVSKTRTDPQLDLYYRITPSLNGSLTINTDFSATEVDDRQVNLTRFGLFFPEKRTFFLNDSDLFEFGRIGQRRDANQASGRPDLESGRPFFSRRVGLSSAGTPLELDAGAKLSGRMGAWTIGSLAVRQDAYEDVDASDLFVARLARDLFAESKVGFILTDGDPRSNIDNTVMGVDFQYLNTRLASGGTLEGTAWYQQSETPGLEGDDAAWGFGMNLPNAEGIRGSFEVKEIEENFFPALGYVNRTGVQSRSAQFGYTKIFGDSWLQQAFSGIDIQRIDSIDGGLQSEILIGRLLELENRQEDAFKLIYERNKEFVAEPFTIYEDITRSVEVPAGLYNFDMYGFDLASAQQRRRSVQFNYRTGDFYGGDRMNVSGNFRWKPIPNFNITLSYDWNDISLPDGDFTTRLVGIATETAFSMRWFWLMRVQYDNVSEVFGVNSRLQWIPKAGQEAFIVLNHNSQDFDKNNTFESDLSDVTLKFTYTFRF